MRAGLVLCASLAPALAGCGSAVPLITVDQLVKQCDALKGKPVRLAGYLGECAGYSCHLFRDRAELAELEKVLSTPFSLDAPADAHNQKPLPSGIGIGGDRAFDHKAAPFQNSYVVITGRVDDYSCDGRGGTDRSAGVHPTDIRAWTPSEGAPANTK